MKKPKRRRGRYVKTLLHNGIILCIVGSLLTAGVFLLWASTLKIPDLRSLEQRKVSQSTKIYDRTGEILLFDVHEDVQRTVVPFDGISRNIKNATIAIEDAEFYEHNGIKPKAIMRAVFTNLINAELLSGQGGSTITQQVIKNAILTKEKKISRKLKEWVLALKLEQELGKEQILELYLNETPYGGNVYGIEEASNVFFDTSASELTLAEAAYLAALPQAPTYYSPYGNHRDELEARKNLVLERMYLYGFVSKDEYEKALAEKVVFEQRFSSSIKAPHFVMFIREYLAEKYGERALEERGFRVITTLDYSLQEKAERIVAEYAEINTKNFNATNASLTAIDPKTGQILVMVGSRGFFDKEIDGNYNITLARRQPGSAFKPFVYATAFMKGYTPETVVFDVATQFSTTCAFDNLESDENTCYTPGNYDNVFRGPVTFREALAQSINVPAVKVLYLSGLEDSLQTARSQGISTLTNSGRYGLTLVLGGGEVSLLDMTSAYGVFAREGVRNPYVGILRIEDNVGKVIEEYSQRQTRVIPEQVALQITDILSDNEARAPAFGNFSPLYFPGRDVAAKTGTTNDYRDAWIVGYTPNVVVGAWAGNNDNTPMEKKVAGFTIAPLWHAFMQEVFKELPEERFRKPFFEDTSALQPILRGKWEGGTSYFVDTISGKLATEFTPQELREERIIQNIHSILYWVDKNNPRGATPQYPDQNPQFRAWEYGVSKWKESRGITDTPENIPTSFDDVHGPEFTPQVTIVDQGLKSVYGVDDILTLQLRVVSSFPITKIDVFVNGSLVTSSTHNFPTYSLPINSLESILEKNTIKIVAYDNVLNRGEGEMAFTVR